MAVNFTYELCTRCSICSSVCPMGIISPADKATVPDIPVERAGTCISCGQCEAFCPAGAVTVNQSAPGQVQKAWNGDNITPEQMDLYLKSRRTIRQFRSEPVSRETITGILDIARYAASGGNGQPVQWLVIHDSTGVRKVASLTIDWMKTLVGTANPMSSYLPSLIAGWDAGIDVICRGAPHLLIPHIPADNPIAQIDSIIALTHVDIAAPVFGVGTCWAGFVAMASKDYAPLTDLFALPDGRIPAYAMMFGYPRFKPAHIPVRNPLSITWHENRADES